MNKFGIPQSVLDAVSGILNNKQKPEQIDETMSVHVKPHENGTHYTVTKVGAAMKKHGGVKVGDKLSDTHIDDLHDSDVEVHHEEVQVTEEKCDCDCGKSPCVECGKDHHMKEEAKDLDTGNVDKALQHDCASHVVHNEWGNGLCIPGMHTLVETEKGKGVVTHYDVLFDHGIEEDVAVEDLYIVKEMSHGHPKKKKMKEAKLDPVGQEDDDIDNDGDSDKSDSYLRNRRRVIGSKLKKKVTEAADNRQAQSTGQASNMAKHYYNLAKKANEAGNTASASKFMRLAKSFYRKSEGMQDRNKQGQQQQVGELYWSDEELAHLSEKSGLETKTLASYMTKASNAQGHRKLSTKKVDNRYAGVKKASDELERRNTMGEASGQRVTKAAKEEPEHIGVQLRKVVNIGPNHGGVEFSNGKKEKVHPSIARRAMDRYNKAKPAEKEELQKHMAHSHDALKHVASGGSLDSSPAK